MANAADREVWLNFLDEVDEYLNTIESVLIGLAETGVNPGKMDAALRAVHTIKGIGSMIECPAMSALAHRFEDSLKIIKARRSSVQVDAALEMLLLKGLDSMRQISSLHRQALPITENWLTDYAYPAFEKLRNRLGDVQPSDELALLAEESDDDTAVVMFSTEVEELLERLTSVLSTPGLPCLREELEMMVEELHDLGKMLQLDAFSRLCQSIHHQLTAASSHQVETVARKALELWQRSQALVMVGKLDKLPTQMELTYDQSDETVANDFSDVTESMSDSLLDLSLLTEDSPNEIPNFETFLSNEELAIKSPTVESLFPEEEVITEIPNFELFLSEETSETVISDAESWVVSEPEITVPEDQSSEDITPDISYDRVEPNDGLDSGDGYDIEQLEDCGPDSIQNENADESNSRANNAETLETEHQSVDAIVSDTFDPSSSTEFVDTRHTTSIFTPVSTIDEALRVDAHITDHETVESIDNVDLTGIEAAIENFDPTEFQLDPFFESESTVSIEHEVTVEDVSFEPQVDLTSFFQAQTETESEEFVEIYVEPVESAKKGQDPQGNTVRVPIKLLTQLNDLFGELIIQRNTMNSRLDQMEDLMNLFSKRMKNLESTNTQLQTFCNQLAVDTSVPAVKTDHGITANITEYNTVGHLLRSQSAITISTTEQTFDSLELDRYSDLHLLTQEQRETLVQLREVNSDVKLNMREIKQASSNLNRTAKALQINVTRARMRPLSDIVERFPRTVRELSLQYGKTVELKISGGTTLIDRFVAVHLRDPLMHLLRNAFDHGIEDAETRQSQGKSPQGTIEIRAAHRGNQTLITISDDGAGINLDKIRDRAYQLGLTDELLNSLSQSELLGMIFEPGFSTADQVTNLSGRGIGMDVVRTNLEQIRSEIKVDTQPGMGTTFTISVPFTLSIVRVLLVESGGMRLAFPTDGIEEMIRLNSVQVFDSPDQKVINWEGLTVPLIHLDKWLEFRGPLRSTTPEAPPIINEPSILIVSRGERLSGIYIERFWGEREVVIRQVENIISLPPGFNGCTILEDGHVVPLADATKLLEWIDHDKAEDTIKRPQNWQHLLQVSKQQLPPQQRPPQQLALPQVQQTSILVVDDSINMRQLLRTTLEQEGYRVEQGKDGQDAVDQLFKGLSVDAIVCDIEMPRLDGYGVLAEIKADTKLKHLPIIMLTSRGSEKHRQLAMRLGANAYITKPYQDHELLQMIEQVLQQQPLSTVR